MVTSAKRKNGLLNLIMTNPVRLFKNKEKLERSSNLIKTEGLIGKNMYEVLQCFYWNVKRYLINFHWFIIL